MNEIIFHIGTPKTGSSALQVFLARNRENLLKSDVDYLPIGEISLGAAGKISSGNGSFVSRCVLPPEAPARIADGERHIDEFFNAVRRSDARVGIVSSELFISADKTALSALLERLRKMSITARCFYYIRSQVQFMASSYMQVVKRHGGTEQPETFVRREYKHSRFLKHHSFYLEQVELYGRRNVICRSYDSAVETPNGLFHGMADSLSIPTDGLNFDIQDINTSLSTRDLCIMLLLNRFKPRMMFSDMVIENAIQFGSAAAGKIHNILPPALVDEIEQYFEQENANMAKDVFHRPKLFANRSVQDEQEPVSIDNVTISDLVGFFGGLLVKYDERLVSLENRMTKLLNSLPKTNQGTPL